MGLGVCNVSSQHTCKKGKKDTFAKCKIMCVYIQTLRWGENHWLETCQDNRNNK